MNKALLFKSLLVLMIGFFYSNAFATIDWVGNMFPTSGSSTTITEGTDHTVYVQVFKSGVTEPGGQGAGIMCELYYGDVDAFGMPWNNVFTQAMTYNVDIGNNDEYQATIAPSSNLYEITCRCSDDGGASWTFASLGSGNAMLTVEEPLPVELSSFSAYQEARAVHLHWITENEVDHKHFEIEQSNNLEEWTMLASVDGMGTSFVANEYSLEDDQPSLGLNYYRLKQVSLDGSFVYSEIISVDFKQTTEVNVFPNPTNDRISIQLKEAIKGTFNVFNLQGQIVESRLIKEEDNFMIDLSTLLNGIYFYQILDQDGYLLDRKKLVKN